MNVVARALRQSAGVRRVLRPATRHAGSSQTFRRAYAAQTSSSRNIDNLIESLRSSGDVSSIRHAYSALASELKNSNAQPPAPFDDNGSMVSVLQSLATSGQPEDTRIIHKILTDLSPILGIIPSNNLYTLILQALVDNGHEEQAHSFLLDIPRLPHNISPDIEQFHLVLESCTRLPTFTRLIGAIKSLNLTPTSQTFVIIFHTRSRIASQDKLVPNIKDVTALISSCIRIGLTYDPAVVDILYDIYAAKGRFAQASAILEIYQSMLSSNSAEGSAKANGNGQTPPTAGMRSTASMYADALSKSLLKGNSEEAVHIYTEALQAGVTPLDSIIGPFLKAVSRDPSAEEHLDKAVDISRVLADAVVPIPSNSTSGRFPDRPYGPGLSIYHGLIRALCEVPNVEKYSVVIKDLLDEMKTRGLPDTTSVCAAARIILAMREVGGFKQAIDVYREDRGLLNEYGYGAVLKEYCRISFAGDLQLPLVTEYFSIVQDMRLRNVPISSVIYHTFLLAVGMKATDIQGAQADYEMVTRLIDSTRRVHDFLTLDASIAPDAILWNQLMNTYQRLGCFAEACRLWDVMYLTGRYNQISVNIMLDACSFSRNLPFARTILAKLERARFKIDLRNWNTWVECLCRANKFDEALDVLLVKIRQNGLEPDLQGVRVLLKFAKRLPKEQGDAVCLQVEKELPHLWKRLPKELRNR